MLSRSGRSAIPFSGLNQKPLSTETPTRNTYLYGYQLRGHADQWRLYLLGQGLAENTVRRRCGMAKQFFRVAVRRKPISSNPFEDFKAAVQGNPKRFYFITLDEAEKVLEACPRMPSGGRSLP